MLLKVPKRKKFPPFGWYLGEVIPSNVLALLIEEKKLPYTWAPSLYGSSEDLFVKCGFVTFIFQVTIKGYVLRSVDAPS